LNILIAPSWYPTAENPGSGVFFRDQALALSKAGHQVTLVYVQLVSTKKLWKENFRNEQDYYDENLHCCILKAPSWGANRLGNVCKRYTRTMKKALKYAVIKDGPFDIAHAHSFMGAGYALCHNRDILNCPVIVTEHLSSITERELSNQDIRCLKDTLKNADKFIAVSQHLADCIKSLTGYEKEILVVPNILNPLFHFENIQKPRNEFRFISVGALIPRKQMDQLIRTFSLAFETQKNVTLAIVGKGPEYDKLKTLVQELEMDERISFLGQLSREKLAKEFTESNVFVLTSRSETFGVVYIEAMACGLPVIGTLNGGSNEVLNTYGATAVEVGNIEQLVQAMQNMKEEYDTFDFKKISENAIQRYGSQAVVATLEFSYELLMKAEINLFSMEKSVGG